MSQLFIQLMYANPGVSAQESICLLLSDSNVNCQTQVNDTVPNGMLPVRSTETPTRIASIGTTHYRLLGESLVTLSDLNRLRLLSWRRICPVARGSEERHSRHLPPFVPDVFPPVTQRLAGGLAKSNCHCLPW